ncbi:MAG: asparagine synthase, partial [Chitinophagaceae bacterium]|nr:asparagine synthase [Chitinophagaceae bacterium]
KSLYNQIQNNSLLEPDFIHHSINKNSLEKPVIRTLNDILYYNTFTNGLEDLLRYADRNAMAHGREIRLPFLNHELVEFVFSLPSHFKIRNGFTKYVLRNAMKETLPKEIIWRKDKIGFEPPQQKWLQHKSIEPLMQQAKQKLISKGILKKNVLQKPLETLPVHAAHNYSWWILCAGNLV